MLQTNLLDFLRLRSKSEIITQKRLFTDEGKAAECTFGLQEKDPTVNGDYQQKHR